MLAACASKTPADTSTVSGGLSAVVEIDSLMQAVKDSTIVRSSSLLGVYVSEYLSTSPIFMASAGALQGIATEWQIIAAQSTIADPDFDLIQAFADALQVDVPDLLNRSPDRQQALDTYTTALSNVATRGNARFKELSSIATELSATQRTQNREKSDAERALSKALSSKDFTDAGDKQRIVLEKQQAAAETDLQVRQTNDVIKTLDRLLTLYGQKIMAIEQNREVLIAGNKVVDVPGIEELKLIQDAKGFQKTSRKSGTMFDSLFQSSK